MANPIVIVSGTNRPGSNALKIAKLLKGYYDSARVDATLYSLEQLPREIFDPGCYASKPESFVPVQKMIVESAGLHVVTPEYNGTFPGVLKYFIDMLKFPESFERKPVAFVGEAAGQWGALRSVEQLQQIFGYRNAFIFPERVFIPGVGQALNDAGELTNPDLVERLQKQVSGFADFIKRLQA
jgi:NAD(P)H-dependent FMN reductase